MGTEIAKRAIPAPTPQHDRSLSPQGLQEHRAAIASEVCVILSAYFQPSEAEDIRAAQLAWWCDELQDWTREQVVYALRQWNRDSPDKRPTPGHISRLLRGLRGRREAARLADARARDAQPAPPRQMPTPDKAREIMAQAGIAVKGVTPTEEKTNGH